MNFLKFRSPHMPTCIKPVQGIKSFNPLSALETGVFSEQVLLCMSEVR